jgi:hypothetical protein
MMKLIGTSKIYENQTRPHPGGSLATEKRQSALMMIVRRATRTFGRTAWTDIRRQEPAAHAY